MRALSQWTAVTVLMVTLAEHTPAQSTATLIGQVFDPSGNLVPGAQITLKDEATGELQTTRTNEIGHYLFAGLLVGTYRISVNASGFRVFIVENLTLEVGRTVLQNFKQTRWHPTRQSARRRTFSLRLRDEVE
jgi:Carboxypeptidase regulatory-like domain